MTHALVLGGGGPVGVAWELGVVAGLADAGIEAAKADRILGTSAGAIVGAQIAAGLTVDEIFQRHLVSEQEGVAASDIRDVTSADLGPLLQMIMRRPPGEMSSPALLREMGAHALAATTIDEAAFVAQLGQLIVTGHDWPARFACTAVEATTGAFQVWDAAAGVALPRGVASSCAVPGVYPPVTIGQARYIDGGMRSPINADVVAGCDVVLVLAVTVEPVAAVMAAMAGGEVARLAAGGSRAALVVPDAASLAAFGPNLMESRRYAAVAEAGRVQGRAEADRLRGDWH